MPAFASYSFLFVELEAREAPEDRPPASHVVQGFDLRVIGHQRLLRVGGRNRLTYEFVLTSFSRSPITPQGIEFVGATNGQIIGVLPDHVVASLAVPLPDLPSYKPVKQRSPILISTAPMHLQLGSA